MNIIEEHTSPDLFLRLIITRAADGDVALGFAGYAWHTHGDILSTLAGLPENEAIRQFVNRILGDEQIIVVSRVQGEVREVWPTDDPREELRYRLPEESLEFRCWSGVTVPVEECSSDAAG